MLDVTRCGVKIDPRSLCQEPREPDCPFNLCSEHVRAITLWIIDTGWAEPPSGEPVRQLPMMHHDPVVYYLRFGDRVKIGTSANLGPRVRAIPHDHLLALEPGGYLRESSRHRQFASCRISPVGEWFIPDAALWEHIRAMRDQHGGLGLVTSRILKGTIHLAPRAALSP